MNKNKQELLNIFSNDDLLTQGLKENTSFILMELKEAHIDIDFKKIIEVSQKNNLKNFAEIINFIINYKLQNKVGEKEKVLLQQFSDQNLNLFKNDNKPLSFFLKNKIYVDSSYVLNDKDFQDNLKRLTKEIIYNEELEELVKVYVNNNINNIQKNPEDYPFIWQLYQSNPSLILNCTKEIFKIEKANNLIKEKLSDNLFDNPQEAGIILDFKEEDRHYIEKYLKDKRKSKEKIKGYVLNESFDKLCPIYNIFNEFGIFNIDFYNMPEDMLKKYSNIIREKLFYKDGQLLKISEIINDTSILFGQHNNIILNEEKIYELIEKNIKNKTITKLDFNSINPYISVFFSSGDNIYMKALKKAYIDFENTLSKEEKAFLQNQYVTFFFKGRINKNTINEEIQELKNLKILNHNNTPTNLDIKLNIEFDKFDNFNDFLINYFCFKPEDLSILVKKYLKERNYSKTSQIEMLLFKDYFSSDFFSFFDSYNLDILKMITDQGLSVPTQEDIDNFLNNGPNNLQDFENNGNILLHKNIKKQDLDNFFAENNSLFNIVVNNTKFQIERAKAQALDNDSNFEKIIKKVEFYLEKRVLENSLEEIKNQEDDEDSQETYEYLLLLKEHFKNPTNQIDLLKQDNKYQFLYNDLIKSNIYHRLNIDIFLNKQEFLEIKKKTFEQYFAIFEQNKENIKLLYDYKFKTKKYINKFMKEAFNKKDIDFLLNYLQDQNNDIKMSALSCYVQNAISYIEQELPVCLIFDKNNFMDFILKASQENIVSNLFYEGKDKYCKTLYKDLTLEQFNILIDNNYFCQILKNSYSLKNLISFNENNTSSNISNTTNISVEEKKQFLEKLNKKDILNIVYLALPKHYRELIENGDVFINNLSNSIFEKFEQVNLKKLKTIFNYISPRDYETPAILKKMTLFGNSFENNFGLNSLDKIIFNGIEEDEKLQFLKEKHQNLIEYLLLLSSPENLSILLDKYIDFNFLQKHKSAIEQDIKKPHSIVKENLKKYIHLILTNIKKEKTIVFISDVIDLVPDQIDLIFNEVKNKDDFLKFLNTKIQKYSTEEKNNFFNKLFFSRVGTFTSLGDSSCEEIAQSIVKKMIENQDIIGVKILKSNLLKNQHISQGNTYLKAFNKNQEQLDIFLEKHSLTQNITTEKNNHMSNNKNKFKI